MICGLSGIVNEGFIIHVNSDMKIYFCVKTCLVE